MSDLICDACGVKVGSWSARFGDQDTTFCKKCYETDEADSVIANKVLEPKGDSPKNIELATINKTSSNNEVIVTDIKMPFGSMIVFMVKWAIAAIPAMIILFIAFGFVSSIFAGLLR